MKNALMRRYFTVGFIALSFVLVDVLSLSFFFDALFPLNIAGLEFSGDSSAESIETILLAFVHMLFDRYSSAIQLLAGALIGAIPLIDGARRGMRPRCTLFLLVPAIAVLLMRLTPWAMPNLPLSEVRWAARGFVFFAIGYAVMVSLTGQQDAERRTLQGLCRVAFPFAVYMLILFLPGESRLQHSGYSPLNAQFVAASLALPIMGALMSRIALPFPKWTAIAICSVLGVVYTAYVAYLLLPGTSYASFMYGYFWFDPTWGSPRISIALWFYMASLFGVLLKSAIAPRASQTENAPIRQNRA